MNIPTVTFLNPDHNSPTNKLRNNNKPKQTPPPPGITIDLKKARYEIMKMSAKETKDVDAETAIAISLGARPEKRAAVNYKQLVAERREKKAKELPEVPLPKKIKKRPTNTNRKGKPNKKTKK